MRSKILFLFIITLITILMAGCANASSPEKTTSEYINALVAKDANSLSVLSCAEWAEQSQLLLDSFMAVETRLDGLSCIVVENDGPNATVNCTGNIIATYNGEDQELDLSTSTFVLVKQNNEWLVCGQQ